MTFKITLGQLKLGVFIAWLVWGLPAITWLALIQFTQMSYWKVAFLYLLLYSFLVSFELIRGFISRGGGQ